MRPIKLTMNAFGSFLETTIIDFETLNNAGFYLVTGETGSGKTTIFDAIMFALYGEPSGNIREQEGFRNDLAEDKNKTFVELVFEKDHKRYTITRSPKYAVPSRTTAFTEKASLVYDDEVIEKKKTVDEKILEIIGLTVDQFRQVIMLAQGEFMKLIHSNSKEKDEIFRKIFGTEILDEISNLLKDEAKNIKDKLFEVETKLSQLISSLESNDQLLKREIAMDDFYNTKLLIEELNELIAKNEIELEELSNKDKSLNDQLLTIVKQKEVASILNDDFDKLATLINDLETLELHKEEINTFKDKILLLNKIDQIKPIYERLLSIHMQINKQIADCNENKEDLDVKQNELDCYQEQLEYIELDRTSLLKAKEEALLVKNDIEIKEKIITLNASLISIDNKYKDQTEDLENLTHTKTEYSNVFTTLNKSLEGYDDIKTKYELTKVELDRLKSDLTTFLEKTKVLDKRNKIKENIKKCNTEYQTLVETYSAKFNDYQHKELVYYNNIAGILVKELKEGQPCPVCGSIEHPQIAVIKDDVISKEELDLLAVDLENARTKKDNKTIDINSLTALLNEVIIQLLELLNISDESLIEETIKILVEEKEKQINDLSVKINLLEEKLKFFEQTKQEIITIETKINEVNLLIDTASTNLTSLKEQLAAIKGSISTYQEQVKYEDDIEILENALDQYNIFIETLEESITAFDDGYHLAIEEQKVSASKFEQSSKLLNELKTSYDDLSKVYEEKIISLAIDKDIIDNLEEHLQDVSNLGTYIKTVTEFETKYDNLKKTKNELEDKLKGKQKENLEEFTTKIDNLTEEINLLDASITNLNTLVSNNKQIKIELEKAFKVFIKVQKEFDEISELSKTSNGNNPKYLSFERFVLIGYFENILKHANTRLSKMTDGRFVLYRKEDKVKGSAQQGLELEVFDFETGKRRDVKTLSGGETFKAALSLALGLADAIENKVGHISIETLFIDEGFGTLDEKSLHQAIDILLELNDGTKSIGIISHVQELKDIIPTKLIVTKSTDGSKVKIVS